MSKKSIASLILIIVIAFELYIFMSVDPVTKNMQTRERTEGDSLFCCTEEVVDYEAQNQRNIKFSILIGATVIGGGIVVFSLKDRKQSKDDNSVES
jgi:hypothetical protein